MEFLKKHYEKILLGLVLLGLVGGLVFLPFIIKADNDDVETSTKPIFNGTPKPLPPVDLTMQNEVLQKVSTPYQLDFDNSNKVFNPMIWQKAKDGSLIPLRATDYGVPALKVTAVTPLYLIISLASSETNELGASYTLQIEQQAAIKAGLRAKIKHNVSSAHPKIDVLTFVEAKGPPENPTEVDVKLNDTGELAVITKDVPFQKIEGYVTDLKYPPENNRTFPNLRVNSVISFAGDSYSIVDIKANEVVLSAQSNQKRYTKSFSP
jgi:hypothetical protein